MSETMRLIRCIQKSDDRSAADMLVQIYYDEIYRFVRKQISDDNSALDLTQGIFISLLKTIGRYDEKKGAGFRTWLYKIATNKTIDYFRSKTSNLIETLSIDDIELIDEMDFTLRFEDNDFTDRVCDYVILVVAIAMVSIVATMLIVSREKRIDLM